MSENNSTSLPNMPDISNEISEKQKNEEVNKKSSMPFFIKVGIPVGVIIFLLIIITAFNIMNKPNDKKAFSKEELAEFETVADSLNINKETQNSNEMNHIAKVNAIDFSSNEVIMNLKQQIKTLENALIETTNSNKNLRIRENVISEKMNELNTLINSINNKSLKNINDEISNIKNKLTSVSKSVSSNQNRIYRFTKKHPNKPPFILLSIDQWGNNYSAVLELNGESSTASVGDVRAGWRISEIIKPNCITAIRLSDANKTKICRTGEV